MCFLLFAAADYRVPWRDSFGMCARTAVVAGVFACRSGQSVAGTLYPAVHPYGFKVDGRRSIREFPPVGGILGGGDRPNGKEEALLPCEVD